MNNKLDTKDLINIGIFTALYFVVVMIAAFTGYIPIMMVIMPALCALVGAIPFMLFLAEHRLCFLADLADRLILLKDGRILEDLGPEAIRALSEDDLNDRGLRTLSVLPLPEPEQDDGHKESCLICRDFYFQYKNSDNGIRFSELRFSRGEITAIIGRNGAGKSTFARVLCGLERKAKGTVFFDGRQWPRPERSSWARDNPLPQIFLT